MVEKKVSEVEERSVEIPNPKKKKWKQGFKNL